MKIIKCPPSAKLPKCPLICKLMKTIPFTSSKSPIFAIIHFCSFFKIFHFLFLIGFLFFFVSLQNEIIKLLGTKWSVCSCPFFLKNIIQCPTETLTWLCFAIEPYMMPCTISWLCELEKYMTENELIRYAMIENCWPKVFLVPVICFDETNNFLLLCILTLLVQDK